MRAFWGLLPTQPRGDLPRQMCSFSQQDQREGKFARSVNEVTQDHGQVAGGRGGEHPKVGTELDGLWSWSSPWQVERLLLCLCSWCCVS